MDQADSVHSTPPTNTSPDIPRDDSGKPVEGLYYPTPVTPEEAFQAIGRLRKEARDEIDRLIRFLDETDNHMEREEAVDDTPCDYNELELSEGDDEPSLGSHEIRPGGAVSYLSHPIRAWDANGETYIDGEVDDCDDEESDEPEIGADDEPSLGSFDRLIDQDRAWQQKAVWFSNSDAEADPCD